MEKKDTKRNKGDQLINMGMTLFSTPEWVLRADHHNKRERNKAESSYKRGYDSIIYARIFYEG